MIRIYCKCLSFLFFIGPLVAFASQQATYCLSLEKKAETLISINELLGAAAFLAGNSDRCQKLSIDLLIDIEDRLSIKNNRQSLYELLEIYGPKLSFLIGRNLALAKHKDKQRVKIILEYGAFHGNTRSQFLLGKLYEKGEFLELNYALSKVFYNFAAFEDNADAQFNLALLYWQGVDGPKDTIAAERWFSLAASNGICFANKYLADIFSEKNNASKKSQKYLENYQKCKLKNN